MSLGRVVVVLDPGRVVVVVVDVLGGAFASEPLLHAALERFLGCSQDEIIFVAKDTLEGNLRGVIAELSPEEIKKFQEAQVNNKLSE